MLNSKLPDPGWLPLTQFRGFSCFIGLSESHWTLDSKWPLNSIMVFDYTLALYGFLNSCIWLFLKKKINWGEELDLLEYFRGLGSCLLIQPFWLYLWILTMGPFWKHCLMAKEGLLPPSLWVAWSITQIFLSSKPRSSRTTWKVLFEYFFIRTRWSVIVNLYCQLHCTGTQVEDTSWLSIWDFYRDV